MLSKKEEETKKTRTEIMENSGKIFMTATGFEPTTT